MSITYNTSVVRNGLVLQMDAANRKSYQGSGTIWNDLSNSQSIGELVNSPTYNAANSGYFQFVTDDYARIPNNTALDNQTFTVEVWVKTNNLTQGGFWFEKGTVNSQYSLFQESSFIRCRINNGSGLVDTISVTTANYMTTSLWYQVAFTFTTGSQICYINTAVAGTGTTTATLATSNGGMSIGAYGGYSGSRGYYYDGNLSICRVYNRVLTAAEIAQNFNAQRGRYGI